MLLLSECSDLDPDPDRGLKKEVKEEEKREIVVLIGKEDVSGEE